SRRLPLSNQHLVDGAGTSPGVPRWVAPPFTPRKPCERVTTNECLLPPISGIFAGQRQSVTADERSESRSSLEVVVSSNPLVLRSEVPPRGRVSCREGDGWTVADTGFVRAPPLEWAERRRWRL